jgi:hypothetical protein
LSNGANGIQLYDGVANPTVTASIVGKRMLAVRFKHGSQIKVSTDGTLVATSANNSVIANSPTGDFVIGGYDYYAAGCDAPVQRVIFINSYDVTDQEISQLYDEMMTFRGAGNPKVRNFQHQAPPIDSNCVLAYDMATRTGDGKMADLSGSGRHGTIAAGNTLGRLKSGFNAIDLNGSVRGIEWTPFSIGTVHTLEWLHAPTETEYEVFEESTNAYFLYINGTGTALVYAAGGITVSWTIPVLTNKESHIVIDRSDTRVTLYVDGVSMGDRTLAANNPIITFTCLNSSSALYSMSGKIGYCQLYSTSKGATWASNRYKQYAKKVVYQAQAENYLPTLANVTAGKLSNTDLEVLTGSYKVSQDATKKKWIECVTAGLAWMYQNNAYGTYVFEVLKANTANIVDVMFIADTKDTGAATGQDGYQLRINANEAVQVNESINGAQTTRIYTGVGYVENAVAYKIAISRSSLGEFYVLIKGGAFPNWIPITATGNPITDNTATTSKYLTIDLDAGDKFRLLGIHAGVLGIPELSALYK